MSTCHRVFALILLGSLLLTGCGPAAPTPTPVATAVLVAAVTSPTTAPVFPTATPAPTRTPAPPATPRPTPLAPLDGRGGGVLAFTSERGGNADIYLMNADGSGERRLTTDPAYDGWPAWSPDGLRIAFMSTRSGNPDIYVMDADGSNVRQLTTDPANDIWPEWSPDGTRIVFPSRRDGNFEIYVVDADGTNLQRLTDTPASEDFPAWSPDGTRIVYARIEGDDGTYIMNADGSDQWKLTDIVGLEFAWSPDGTRIVFGSDYEGFRGLYVLDVDGAEEGSGRVRRLSNSRAGENCPTWSPDGTQIAFASWRDGDGEIYAMNADGATEGSRNLQKLTDNAFEDEFPAWRPDPLFSSAGGTEFITRIYGSPDNDRVSDILLLADGGTLIAGQANSKGLSHRIPPGNARLIRTAAQGNIVWEKDHGGEVDAVFSSLVQVEEDAYVALGQIAASYERDETDFYLVKIDGEGNEIWSHTYGGRGMGIAEMVRQTADGGFVLIGDRADEFPTGYVYESNIALVKTDAQGNEVWTQTYGARFSTWDGGLCRPPTAVTSSLAGRPRPSMIGTSL